MDLDGDGHLDILSGSYSRMEGDMAGLFQVLKGGAEGFAKPQPLKGKDGEPLIIPVGDADVIRAICTRPFAADLDGDGRLDIVSGNFEGTFWLFRGAEGGGFEPVPSQLRQGEGALRVAMHSDPFLVDWDKDGDLDLLSGSADGGVQLFPNVGSRTEPRFGEGQVLLAAQGSMHGIPVDEPVQAGADGGEEIAVVEGDAQVPGPVFGDAHVTGPQGSTRVWADDLNGDGKLDLLVGDSIHLEYPAEGLTEDEARAKLQAWNARLQESMRSMESGDSFDEAQQEVFEKLWQERDSIVRSVSTGQVWVLYQQ